jgi:hypothetical protein
MATKAFVPDLAANVEGSRWTRNTPLTGAVAVVLWLVGVFLLEKTDRPTSDALFAAWVSDAKAELVVGGLIFGFGVLFFLWFLSTLRSTLAAAEGGNERLSSLAFASGTCVAICLMLIYLPQAQASFTVDELSEESVAALVHVGDTFFGGVALFAIPMFAATALVIRRTRALPAWTWWLSAAVALCLVIVPLAFPAVVVGLPLWTLARSIALTRKEGR